jgi:hypothetical protein
VLDNPRTNHPDGGVDTQVTIGAQRDPWGYFNGPSTWQYKAIALKDFSLLGVPSGRAPDHSKSVTGGLDYSGFFWSTATKSSQHGLPAL